MSIPQELGGLSDFIKPLMAGFEAPWCIAGGWALDCFLNRQTRSHADLELAIFRQDQALLHGQFPDWVFEKIVAGRREAWDASERLQLPVHEIHARSPADPTLSIEFLLNERDATHWIFRRNPSITQLLKDAIARAADDLPVLSPEVVLLYKAKTPRPKDEADFALASEALSRSQNRWLRRSLGACHPSHPWIHRLDREPRR